MELLEFLGYLGGGLLALAWIVLFLSASGGWRINHGFGALDYVISWFVGAILATLPFACVAAPVWVVGRFVFGWW